MANVKWIKIMTDLFDDEKILLIESLPEADSIIVIWFKLLCLAGKQNNSGVFMLNDKIPYTEEMLATIFRRPLNVVRLALKTFQTYGMIEIVENTITIPNWTKHQSLDDMEKLKASNRQRVAAYRERQKQIASGDCNVTVTLPVTLRNAVDKEEDIDKDKNNVSMNERKKKIYKENIAHAHTYEDIMQEFCVSVPVKDKLYEFIKHLKLNNVLMINDRLEKIIVRLDMSFSEDSDKIECIDNAIAGGYKKLSIE
ncbi:MAG: phage replisome organizer N-terminal domain-containing protein [Clostridia bacterium]|nr:phage replisome organizer N-terminal domain-containing protein [Clostridia bacterium]